MVVRWVDARAARTVVPKAALMVGDLVVLSAEYLAENSADSMAASLAVQSVDGKGGH